MVPARLKGGCIGNLEAESRWVVIRLGTKIGPLLLFSVNHTRVGKGISREPVVRMRFNRGQKKRRSQLEIKCLLWQLKDHMFFVSLILRHTSKVSYPVSSSNNKRLCLSLFCYCSLKQCRCYIKDELQRLLQAHEVSWPLMPMKFPLYFWLTRHSAVHCFLFFARSTPKCSGVSPHCPTVWLTDGSSSVFFITWTSSAHCPPTLYFQWQKSDKQFSDEAFSV